MIVSLLLWTLLISTTVAHQERVKGEDFDDDKHGFSDEDDIKELFFRRLRAYEEDEELEAPSEYFGEIPQPGGFRAYEQRNKRIRRDTNDENDTKQPEGSYAIIGQIEADIAKHVDRSDSVPETSTESQNDTASESHVSDNKNAEPEEEGGLVGINDFIRFRRGLEQKEAKNGQGHTESVMVKHIGELSHLNPFPVKHEEQQRTSRMLMQEDNDVPEGSREPRGATKEQWVKQPYPVRTVSVDDNNYEDNVPSPSDARAPRVHFVTQRRLESAPPPVYRNYEREGRAKDFFRDLPPRNAPRSPPAKPDGDYYPSERRPPRPYNTYRDDPYYRYEESRYDPRYRPADYDRDRPEYSSRQRRIIYYATLPEVVRTPPNVNLRDRYSYRDRYDDRYVTSPALSVNEGNEYRYRKPYPFTKSRYDQEIERTKASYPLKVSTDVNVRETKKNPERRIYSEPDRRYAYKTPAYQPEESFNHRT